MISGVYKIADCVFEIKSFYPLVHKMCKDYIYNGRPEFSITVDRQMIDFEDDGSADDSYLETLAVLRKLSDNLIEKDILLIHGSAISFGGEGYLFSAKSGIGKSTHTALWKQRFGDRVTVINDDKPFVKITEQEARIFGTPWNGKHNLSANVDVPLKSVCFLKRSKDNFINKKEAIDIYHLLLSQTYKPTDKLLFERTVKLIGRLSKLVSFYELECNMDISAADIALNGMK